jgi:hypothetical protein
MKKWTINSLLAFWLFLISGLSLYLLYSQNRTFKFINELERGYWKTLGYSRKNAPFHEVIYQLQPNLKLESKFISIRNLKHPVKPFLSETKDGFIAVFRNDEINSQKDIGFSTSLCMATFDKNLNQIGETLQLETESSLIDTPQVFLKGDQTYFLYKNLTQNTLVLGKLNVEKGKIEPIVEVQ